MLHVKRGLTLMTNERNNPFHFDTIALHEGQTVDPVTRSRAVPSIKRRHTCLIVRIMQLNFLK